MNSVDALTVANLAMRVGLLNAVQVQEGWDEVGKGDEADRFLKVMQRKGYLTPFQSQKLIKQDKDGYLLGGYRILYKIASGSFGRVYRGDDPRSGRIVAIKVLRKKWSEDKHNIELFEREGKMGMTLKHPNIVEILAVSRDAASRQYYIIMEFVEGGNLRELLKIRKTLDATEVLRIVEEIASGLDYALSRGFTHRDMKLTNVLVSSTGTSKLVDFGLAQIYAGKDTSDPAEKKDKDEVAVDRTVDYAGLEKATHVPSGDTRSDIFFLGCIAYELLTGRSPLDMTRNAKARMSKERFLNVPPIEPGEINGPESVIVLLQTMMSLNPMERFQTPGQVVDAVREVRREAESKAKAKARDAQAGNAPALFLVEGDARLQELLKDKLKAQGYRVILAADPARALDRFKQQPYDLLVVNAGSAGETAMLIFERLMEETQKMQIKLGGVLILNQDQAAWEERFESRDRLQILTQPITFKQLLHAIQEVTQ